MLSSVRPLQLPIMAARYWCRALHFWLWDVNAKRTSSRSRTLSPALSDRPAVLWETVTPTRCCGPSKFARVQERLFRIISV